MKSPFYMSKTQTILIRNQEERIGDITRMTDAGWKLVKEKQSTVDKDGTILTFEREDDNLATPENETVLTAEHVAEFLGSAIRRG